MDSFAKPGFWQSWEESRDTSLITLSLEDNARKSFHPIVLLRLVLNPDRPFPQPIRTVYSGHPQCHWPIVGEHALIFLSGDADLLSDPWYIQQSAVR